MNTAAKYYVYEWVRPDYGVVFWVGKGHGKRAHTFKRNRHANNIINFLAEKNMKPEVRILARFVSERNALDYEIERIAFWRPLGELANYTDGGQGASGYRHTPEVCKARSEYNVMRRPEVAKKRSGDNHHSKRIPGYVSFFATENNPSFSEQNILRMTSNDNPMRDSSIAEKNAIARAGKKRTPEQIARIKAGQRAHQQRISPEQRAESNKKGAETRRLNRLAKKTSEGLSL